MVITKKYAKHLVNQGKAVERGLTREGLDYYLILDRLDAQRTDHCLVDPKDVDRLSFSSYIV